MSSLARRLAAFMALATVGFGIAVVALVQARNETDTVRSARAFAQASAVTEQLLRTPNIADSQAKTHDALMPLLAPLIDASGGYCDARKLLAHSTVAPLFAPALTPGALGLLPLDRDAVLDACAKVTGAPLKVRFAAPNDLLFIVVAPLGDGRAAWALVRMPNRTAARAALPLAAALTAVLLTLLASALLTMRTLRRDSAALARALTAIPDDLETVVPTPTLDELAHLADGLRAMTRRLREANEREQTLRARLDQESRLAALGRVVAGVSHEIRNPLAGLKLRLDSTLRRGLEPRSARDVTQALAEVDRLNRVVVSLLALSRRPLPGGAAVALDALVAERVAAIAPAAATHSIFLTTNSTALTAIVDRDALTGALDNLLRNAVEASPPGGTVTVHLAALSAVVRLVVEDDGDGVAPANQEAIFEPFFTDKPGGTGLGLSLARAALDGMGGALTYERVAGKTRFIAHFPLLPPQSPSE